MGVWRGKGFNIIVSMEGLRLKSIVSMEGKRLKIIDNMKGFKAQNYCQYEGA